MQRFFFFLKIYAVYSGSVDFYRGIKICFRERKVRQMFPIVGRRAHRGTQTCPGATCIPLLGTETNQNVPAWRTTGTLEHPNVPWRHPHPFVGNGY